MPVPHPSTELSKFELATDLTFGNALMDFEDGQPVLQKYPFKTIGDRVRFITILEAAGFQIINHNP